MKTENLFHEIVNCMKIADQKHFGKRARADFEDRIHQLYAQEIIQYLTKIKVVKYEE